MLTVRRADVTDPIAALADRHHFIVERGKIIITERFGLEHLGAGSYGLAESQYDRFVGVARRRNPKVRALKQERLRRALSHDSRSVAPAPHDDPRALQRQAR